jgi:transmembrane sensor
VQEDLLQKFFKGTVSRAEAQNVLKWIKSRQATEDIDRLFDSYKASGSGEKIDSEGILQKLHHRIHMEELIKSLEVQYKNIDNNRLLHDRAPVEKHRVRQAIKWQKTFIYATILMIMAFGIYVLPKYLQNTTEVVAQEIIYVKKITEKGQKLNMQLSDGSRVTLNSASTLVYQEYFNDSIRHIELIGEAYFDVSHDSSRPFIVKTGDLQTLALGTSFNIRYRPENNVNQVALVSGRVEVGFIDDKQESVLLQAGEMAEIDFKGKLIQENFDIQQITAWKDAILYFNEAGLEEIIKRLENWYGVNIILKGHPKEVWKFSAKFENESLRNVLDALQYAQGFNYTLKDKLVTIEFH